MKVLHVIPSINPLRGGPTYAVINTVKALRKIGIDSQILTVNDYTHADTKEESLTSFSQEDIPIYIFNDLRILNHLTLLGRDKAFLFSYEATIWLWNNISNYDLIETRYLFSYLPESARMISRIKQTPYIAHPTGMLDKWALSQSQFKKKVYKKLIGYQNLNNASAIQCSSVGEKEDIRQYGISSPPIHVIPLGVDIPQKQEDSKKLLFDKYNISINSPVILFISRLHPKKRVELLLNSLHIINNKNIKFHLIIAGHGEKQYTEQLKLLVKSLRIQNKVTFTGFVTGYSKTILYQASDIFVLPSYSENFGVVIAEAMAASLPVILTPGIQISKMIADANAGVIVKDTPEDLATEIVNLIQSPHKRKMIGNHAKQFAKDNFSWDTVAHKLHQMYTNILAN